MKNNQTAVERKPHSFCETPEEKCTMNYCDENGCINRKRYLVEPLKEMTIKQLNALGVFENLELFDDKGNKVYEFKAYSYGYWSKRTYDSNGNQLTSENSNGYWSKYTYDSKGKELTYEDSDGIKRGFGIPEFTMEQLVEKVGYNFKIIKQ